MKKIILLLLLTVSISVNAQQGLGRILKRASLANIQVPAGFGANDYVYCTSDSSTWQRTGQGTTSSPFVWYKSEIQLKGIQGAKGDKGDQGIPGKDGVNGGGVASVVKRIGSIAFVYNKSELDQALIDAKTGLITEINLAAPILCSGTGIIIPDPLSLSNSLNINTCGNYIQDVTPIPQKGIDVLIDLPTSSQANAQTKWDHQIFIHGGGSINGRVEGGTGILLHLSSTQNISIDNLQFWRAGIGFKAEFCLKGEMRNCMMQFQDSIGIALQYGVWPAGGASGSGSNSNSATNLFMLDNIRFCASANQYCCLYAKGCEGNFYRNLTGECGTPKYFAVTDNDQSSVAWNVNFQIVHLEMKPKIMAFFNKNSQGILNVSGLFLDQPMVLVSNQSTGYSDVLLNDVYNWPIGTQLQGSANWYFTGFWPNTIKFNDPVNWVGGIVPLNFVQQTKDTDGNKPRIISSRFGVAAPVSEFAGDVYITGKAYVNGKEIQTKP